MIELDSQDVVLQSSSVKDACNTNKIGIKTNQGQQLNVSILSFGGTNGVSLGIIRESKYGNTLHINRESRRQHIMVSLGNELELVLPQINGQDDSVNLYEIESK